MHARLTTIVLGFATTLARAQSPAPIPIAPYRVDGVVVGVEQQELWILYGPARQALEEKKLARVVERELARRADASAARKIADVETARPFASAKERDDAREKLRASELEHLTKSAFAVEGDVELAVQRALDEFAKRYPELDARAEMSRSFRSETRFRSQLAWARVFDRLFLPDDEETRPQLTVDAMKARFGAEYETWRTAWRLADKSVDPQYQNLVRQVVRDHLFDAERFTTSLAGPDFTAALRADEDGDGKPDWTLSTADAWKDVASTVQPDEVEAARRWWTTFLTTHAELEREKLVLSPAEADAAIADVLADLQDLVPTFEAFAVQQHRFPSPETFREFYLASRAFQKKIEPLFADADGGKLQPPIAAQLSRTNARFGGVAIDAEILLVSGYDFAHAAWKPDGLAAARAHAEELAKRMRDAESAWAKHAPGASDPDALWSKLVDAESGWWDPPLPKDAPADAPMSPPRSKGRFGPRESADLMELLELTRYELWTGRADVLDALWTELPAGAPNAKGEATLGPVGGPYAHRWGAVLARVRSRSAPKRALDVNDANQREIVKLDYLDEAFRRASREAVARAKIEAMPSDAKPR